MSQLRDLPPISGAIIWAKQIERQLFTFMKRVEDVLGKGWELYAEGQKLQTESNSFRRKLETQPIYEAWLHEINRRDMQITGRIFEITRNRSTGVYQLIVAFDPQIIVIFKEVRNLLWLGFSVPHSISSIAKDAKRVYPYAVSLMESVRTYTQTAAKVDATPGIAMLVAEYRAEAQQMISKGMALRWENFVSIYADSRAAPGLGGGSIADMREGRPGAYVREFASVVSIFQDRTEALIDMYDEILRVIDELGTCDFKTEAFTGLLARIQKTVSRLAALRAPVRWLRRPTLDRSAQPRGLCESAAVGRRAGQANRGRLPLALGRRHCRLDERVPEDGRASSGRSRHQPFRRQGARRGSREGERAAVGSGAETDHGAGGGERPPGAGLDARGQDQEPGHLPRPSHRDGPRKMVPAVARVAGCVPFSAPRRSR